MTTVLLATPHYSPSVGGVEQYIANLARLLVSRHGMRVVVATTGDPGGRISRLVGDDGVVVYRLPVLGRISKTPLGLGWVRSIRRIIREERVDLVNGHGPVPVFADAARLAAGDRPFVLTYHAGRIRKGRPLPDATCKLYERFVLAATANRAREIICASEYVTSEFPDLFAGRGTTVEPGVDLELFHPAPQVADARIVFAASLARTAAYKALPDLLHAVAGLTATVPDVHLEVVGGGDGEPAYRRLAAELGIAGRVTFAGHLPAAELAAAYRRSRVLALPTHFDNFPTVIVEAMATGRPIVTSRVGAIPSLVADGERGLLHESGDVAALTAALRTVLTDDALARRLGDAGARFVAGRLSWQGQADKTVEVYRRALNRTAPTTVAIVASYYPPKIGGVENYARQVAQAVAAAPGFRGVVLTTNPAGRRTVVERDGEVPVVRLGAWFRLSNTPVSPLWPVQLRRWLRRLRVDVINAHAPVPGLPDLALCVAGRRPTVFTYHAGTMHKGAVPADWLIDPYERFVLPRLFAAADVVVPVSRASLAAAQAGAVLIPPGVDLVRFTPGAAPSRRRRTLLYAGRVDRTSAWKGLDVLLRALTLIPDARLRVVGGGDALDDHRRLAARYGVGDRVDFAGELRGTHLVTAMQEAAVLVLPSLTAAECAGTVLTEAMACGTPVVASAVGGLPYVVAHEKTGLLARSGDHEELAAACRRLLTDTALADSIGAAGRADVVQRYDWNTLTDRYLALYAELTGSRSTAMR
jgi:glycosyltransferase involved in cell wall biosynthesis